MRETTDPRDERQDRPTTDPKDNDPIGRIAKWLEEAREAGYTTRETAEMLADGAWAALGPLGDTLREVDDRWDVENSDLLAAWLADQLDRMAEETEVDNG